MLMCFLVDEKADTLSILTKNKTKQNTNKHILLPPPPPEKKKKTKQKPKKTSPKPSYLGKRH